ncbi:MAG: transcriptional regulator FtrA [Gammaproteobacteria bacterium]
MPKRGSHLVVAVVYDRLCTFEFGCTTEFFALERPELGVPWYGFDVCSVEPGEVSAMGGIRIRAQKGLRRLDQADTIVIPGWRDADERPPAALLKKVRNAYERGARICSICSGVFVLAEAGILNGKRATTHWRYVEKLASRYPEISVEPRSLYVDEGRVLTSAGSAAGLDMFVHLVRRDFGASVANSVAQRLVIPAHREGGQAQYLPRPVPRDQRGRLGAVMEHVRSDPAGSHTLPALARRASMSPRTLQRQFRDTVGMSPHEWVTQERIALAKELLESSGAPLSRVAAQSGFDSIEAFRRQFRRLAGTSPSAYRARFSHSR